MSMATPNISIRKSIAWLSQPPSEPTSTLVLTSSTSHFIDIRILLPPSSSSSSPFTTTNTINTRDLLPLFHLEWAFSGTSRTLNPPPPAPKHSIWHHTIDSRVPLSESPPLDEGDLFPSTESEDETVERGRMINPETGAVGEYEEVWRDVTVERVGKEGKRWCVVLLLEGAREKIKGCVVRVGQYCQGIVKRADGEVGVERWEWIGGSEERRSGKRDIGDWSDDEKEDCGRWERTVRVGDGVLPCAATFTPEKLEVGQRVGVGDMEECAWVVTEITGW